MSTEDDILGSFLSEINNLPANESETSIDEARNTVAEVCVASSKPVYNNYVQVGAAMTASSYADSNLNSNAIALASSTSSNNLATAATTTYLQRDETGAAKVHVRKAVDSVWVDKTLSEWPENDYRLFVGDIAKEVLY